MFLFPRAAAAALTLALGMVAGGCATHSTMRQPAPATAGVQYGQVQSVELVKAQSQTTGVGAVAGGVIGAVLGHQVGSGSGRDAATGVGLVGGALIGNELEKNRRGATDFQRIAVRFDNGAVRSYDLPESAALRVGDRVRVENGQVVRL